MKEFMLLIRNQGDAKAALPAEEHTAFVRQCEVYINALKAAGQLISAQPLLREGMVLSRAGGHWEQRPLATSGEVQVGYYHILAGSLEEAIGIAQRNPEFDYVPTASIEVRPIKTKEVATGFEYPNK
ncbi:YciI family protein [Chitinophaga vietnamensis]|uniref:YciI family protein n=1 Tax=Chitinophaga vietnamensis TaxID=2593957 RepID=UPI001177B612|nr:YciI family protein [Chitinophaga vietnamensis]